MNVAFLDANVFLDALLQRGEYEDAGKILNDANKGMVTVYTSAACLQNVIYFLSKAKITNNSIVDIMNVLLRYVALAQTTEKNFLLALHAGFTDLEDAIQYYTALGVKDMDYFITSNIKDYKKALPRLPVVTPKQFLASYNKTK
ncbi:MAG TPA: PIN domain-containing protein [Parafilimonas sp.]|nr:PIN domain-containing protein [Parafilimonas sp.]